MKRLLLHIILPLAVVQLIAAAIYIGSQQPKFSLNAQQFGLMLLKGGYRSWFLSFSDGEVAWTPGPRNSVVLNDDGSFRRFGYRWWPKFSHVDMRKMKPTNGAPTNAVSEIRSALTNASSALSNANGAMKLSTDTMREASDVIKETVETQKRVLDYITNLQAELAKASPNSNGIAHFELDKWGIKAADNCQGMVMMRETANRDYIPLLSITMPCGHRYVIHWGDRTPTNDVPCTCGNTNHWFIRFETREIVSWTNWMESTNAP